MRNTIIASALLLLLAGFGDAKAQELNALELDDFIDPEQLARDLEVEGKKVFVVTQVLAGGSDRYQYRHRFTQGTTRFGRLATSLYAGRWQGNLKLGTFGHPAAHGVTRFQAKSQVGHYFTLGGSGHTGRTQVGWTYEDRGDAADSTTSPTHELSVVLDLSLQVPGLPHGLTGGMVYARNLTTGVHHFGAAYRLPVRRWPSGSSFQVGAGISQSRERTQNVLRTWPAVVKAEFSADAFLLETGNLRLHATYSPSWRTGNGAWNHEFGVFVSAPLFSGTF